MTMTRKTKATHTEALSTRAMTGKLNHPAAEFASPRVIAAKGRVQMTATEYVAGRMGRGKRTGERLDILLRGRQEANAASAAKRARRG